MKSGRVKGGAAIPAVIDTGRRTRSNMAQPVFNASGLNRGVQGGAAQNIIQITDEDLVQNGGQYKLIGGAPLSMEIVTGRRSKQGAATVVYPVDMLGNYDPSFAGYIYKVLTANPAAGYDPSGLIGFWPQNELAGGVSVDYSGLGHHGAYTAVTLGQPGVPGMGMTSAGYDGLTSFNNIYGAPLANDNGLANPGFETAGGAPPVWANWTDAVGDGAIANEVVIVHEGVDAAKLTSGLTSNTSTAQTFAVVAGTRYRIRFWTQGDGVNGGRYNIWGAGNGYLVPNNTPTGVTGAAYAMVAREFTATVSENVTLYFKCPPVNGGICYFDACEVRRMDGFLGDRGTILAWAQVAAGGWTDGVLRRALTVGVDGNNRALLYKSNVNNNFAFVYTAGGVVLTQSTAALANLDLATYGMTWDISAGATGEVMYYIDGVASGATDVGLGTWLGNLVNTTAVIGASSTIPGNVWSGNEAPVLLYNEAKSPAEMLYLSTV